MVAWNQTGSVYSSWNNSQLYIYHNICILPSTVVSRQKWEGTEADPLRPGDDSSQSTAFTSIESAEGENPAYVSWAKLMP